MSIDLEVLSEELKLASTIIDLELKLNEAQTSLLIKLSNFVRADEDLKGLSTDRAIKKLWYESVDDNNIPYEGCENIGILLMRGKFKEELAKKIDDDRWYKSDERAEEMAAYDLAMYG